MVSDDTNKRNVWEDDDEYASDVDDNESTVRRGVQLPLLRFDGGTGNYTDVAAKEEYRNGLIVTPLRYLGSTRILWDAVPVAKGGSKVPLCGSDDNIRPWDAFMAENVNYGPTGISAGPNCISCPLGQWENRNAPPCKEQHNYAVLLTDDAESTVLVLTVQGNSIKPMAEVWAKLPRKGAIYGRMIKLDSEKRDADGQRYFAIKATLLDEWADPALAPIFKDRFNFAAHYVIKDRNALAREARAQSVTPKQLLAMRSEAINTPSDTPANGEDLPFEDIPQIGEPNTHLYDGNGNRRVFGPDGRIQPRMSEQQTDYAHTLADKLELNSDQLDAVAVEMFAEAGLSDFSECSYPEASELIAKLKATLEAVKDDTKKAKAGK